MLFFLERKQQMNKPLRNLDHSALKANQLTLILFSLLAFVFNLPWLAAGVGAVMLTGTLLGVPGFLPVYRYVLVPLGLLKPQILKDHPEPHRFAQGLGGVFMLSGALALFLGASVLGWGFVWMVIALAALNLFAGFCAGCFIYYWLARLRFPGFNSQPPQGSFPGTRPKE
jgi:hypothetical protein